MKTKSLRYEIGLRPTKTKSATPTKSLRYENEEVDELEMMGEWVYEELPEVQREAVMSIKRPRECGISSNS